MATIMTNDIKKEERIKLACGWEGTMKDNMKGNTRVAEVEGDFTEIGSVYSHDITHVMRNGEWQEVKHTKSQIDLRAQLASMGW